MVGPSFLKDEKSETIQPSGFHGDVTFITLWFIYTKVVHITNITSIYITPWQQGEPDLIQAGESRFRSDMHIDVITEKMEATKHSHITLTNGQYPLELIYIYIYEYQWYV